MFFANVTVINIQMEVSMENLRFKCGACNKYVETNKKMIGSFVDLDTEGDCGERKWIYADACNIRHLVMQMYFDFHEDIIYFGNITNGK